MIPISVGWGSAWLFGLVLARVAGLMLTAPLFSSNLMNVQARVGLTLALSLAFFFTLPPLPAAAMDVAVIVPAMLFNFGAGLLLGLVFRIIASAAALTGEVVGVQMGLGAATLFDASAEQQTALLDRFMASAFTVFFLMMDGHHHILRAFSESFSAVPAVMSGFNTASAGQLARTFGEMAACGLRMAAPVVIPLLVIAMASALLSRAFPALNFISFSYSISIAAGFLLFAVSVPEFGDMARELLQRADRNAARMLDVLRGA